MDTDGVCHPQESLSQIDIKNNINALDDRITELETKMSSSAEGQQLDKEMKYKIQSILLMNEDIRHKEKEHGDAIKKLFGETKSLKKSNNEEFLNLFKELKISNEQIISKLNSIDARLRAVEANMSGLSKKNGNIKIENNKKKPYVLVSFEKESNLDMLKRSLDRKNETWNLIESNGKRNQFKIINIVWLTRNISDILEKCSKIKFNNVDTIDINKSVKISNNKSIDSMPATKLNLRNNSTLIINSKTNVNMNNINIHKCKFGENYLIDVKSQSILELNNGFIENNSGRQTIIHVDSNGILNLNKMIFRKNVQYKNTRIPSCIQIEKQGKININECEFINHSSKNYPYSGYIIDTKGDLNIKSSKFVNNRADYGIIESIKANGNTDSHVNIDDIIFTNCSCMEFKNYNNIIIKNSCFYNNSTSISGGCFRISFIRNIKIEECEFKKNHSDRDGGAIYFNFCQGENSIKNCLFQENGARKCVGGGGGGGAIYLEGGENFRISSSIFNRNKTINYDGGCIYAHNGSSITCGNCTFEGNTTKERGGAIYIGETSKFTQNSPNVFISNSAPNDNDIAFKY